MAMGHGILCVRSHVSWITKNDPFPALASSTVISKTFLMDYSARDK